MPEKKKSEKSENASGSAKAESKTSAPDGKYTGGIKDGKREGVGKLEMSWGGVYEGEFKADKKDGRGTFVVPGSRYEGEWKDDKRAGCGTKVWANGRRYEGRWLDDEINGEGRWRWGDGRYFEGKFKADCPIEGLLLDADGLVYKVTFSGQTDIADSNLRPSMKVRSNPVDEQGFKERTAIWEKRIMASSRIEELRKELETLETNAKAQSEQEAALNTQLLSANKELAEASSKREEVSEAASAAQKAADEAEKAAKAARARSTKLAQEAAQRAAAVEEASQRAQAATAAKEKVDRQLQLANSLLAKCRAELEENLALVAEGGGS